MTALRVLMVESSAEDALSIERELRRGGYGVESARVQTELALRAALSTRQWDLVLSDFSLPSLDGVTVHAIVQETMPDVPFLFISGRIGEERSADALRRGVKDYILKDNLARLVPAVRRELQLVEVHRDRRAADQALKESEEKYRKLVEHSMQGLVIVQKGLIAYCNHAAARMFGYDDSAELMGTVALNLVHPQDRSDLLRTGTAEQLEARVSLYPYYRGIKRDGATIWYEGHVSATSWRERRAVQWAILDITERRRAEEALHANQRLLLAMFETIPHAVFVKDREGRYLMVNRAWCERYNCAPEDAIGNLTGDVPGRPEADKRRAVEEDRCVMEVEQQPIQFTGVDYTRAGKALHFLSFKAPLRDEFGKVTGLVGVVVDTGGIKEAEEELRKSQVLLQTVFDTIPHSLVVKDRQSRYLMVNKAWSATTGVSPQGAVSLLPTDVAHRSPAENARYLKEDEEVFASGETKRFEGMFTNQHHENRYYQAIKAPLRDAHGQVMGLLALLVDVTAERAAQHKADLAHARLSDAIESLPAAFFLYDADERLVLWNSIVEELFPGVYPKLQPGIRFRDIVEATAGDVVEAEGDRDAYIRRRLAQFRHTPGQFELRLKSGRWLQGVDRRTADGGTVSLRFDVTALKNREAELRQAQKMEVVGQLTGGVAHDLNNLLQVISGSILIARRDMDKALPDRELLSTALDACMRAADLTQQLLAFSRKQVLRQQPLDANEVLQGFKAMLSRVLPGSIAVRVDEGPGVKRVHADRGLFEQVLMNLAVNARDAMPDGGTLTFETEMRRLDAARIRDQPWARPGEFLLLQVRDSGSGMPPEVLEHIFEPFYTTKPVGKGTGLGLSTVYGIVQQHNGAIEVESAPGAGTVFSIYWPVRVTDESLVGDASTAPAPHGSESILMVDDNGKVLAVLSESLQNAGYRVKTLESGAEAVTFLAGDPKAVDAVLLDLMMPDMSGIECYQRLMDIRSDLPVLFCSGWASPENEAFLSARGLPVLPKPATPDQLLRAVRTLLDGKPS